MRISYAMQEVVKSCLHRVDAWERRRWMYDNEMFELWKAVDRIEGSNVNLRTAAVRIALALMYHHVPREARKQAVQEIIHLLPFMLAFLGSYYLACLESRAQGEERRKQGEKDWKDGREKPSQNIREAE